MSSSIVSRIASIIVNKLQNAFPMIGLFNTKSVPQSPKQSQLLLVSILKLKQMVYYPVIQVAGLVF